MIAWPIGVLFDAKGTWQQYEAAIAKLEKAGWGQPAARLYQVAGPTDTGFRVFDVWELPESSEEFGKVFVPIVEEVGYPVPEPQIFPAERIIQP